MGRIVLSLREFEKLAIRTLGGNNVVTIEQLEGLASHYDPRVREWEGVPFGVETVSCSKNVEVILGDCAEQNKGSSCDWRVFPVRGLPLRRQRKILGTDPSRQPCFWDNDWWLDLGWAAKGSEASYHLINVMPSFTGISWPGQEKAIRGLGGEYSRCPEQIIAEVAITDAIVFRRKERDWILYDWYHWGCFVGSAAGGHVSVSFGRRGFNVIDFWNDTPNEDLSVAVSRKF